MITCNNNIWLADTNSNWTALSEEMCLTLNYNEFEWLVITFNCIEREWHKSLPVNSENLWNFQFNQKHEIYPEMQWMFGIQAILDTTDTKY